LEIRLSRHAIEKLSLLNSHGLKVRRKLVELTVLEPERVVVGVGGRSIAEKRLDEQHVLRVVFVREESQIRVITMYPTRRGRY
jgi:hypothetical protein